MSQVRIVVLPDGPLRVDGACLVVDERGTPFPPREGKKPGVFLCRCGRSALKPWCDGSHKQPGVGGSETGPPPGPPA